MHNSAEHRENTAPNTPTSSKNSLKRKIAPEAQPSPLVQEIEKSLPSTPNTGQKSCKKRSLPIQTKISVLLSSVLKTLQDTLTDQNEHAPANQAIVHDVMPYAPHTMLRTQLQFNNQQPLTPPSPQAPDSPQVVWVDLVEQEKQAQLLYKSINKKTPSRSPITHLGSPALIIPKHKSQSVKQGLDLDTAAAPKARAKSGKQASGRISSPSLSSTSFVKQSLRVNSPDNVLSVTETYAQLQQILFEHKQTITDQLQELSACLASVETSSMCALNDTIALAESLYGKLQDLDYRLDVLKDNSPREYSSMISRSIACITTDLSQTSEHLANCSRVRHHYEEQLSDFHFYFSLEGYMSEQTVFDALNTLLNPTRALNSQDDSAQFRAMMRLSTQFIAEHRAPKDAMIRLSDQMKLVKQLTAAHEPSPQQRLNK